MTAAWMNSPPAPAPADGPEAFAMALSLVVSGRPLDAAVRAALTRAFGRHLLVRALFAVEAGAAKLSEPLPGLYLCAPHDRGLAALTSIFAPAWEDAISTFGEPPIALIQRPIMFKPRLAATPAVGVAYIQFPLFPAESLEEAQRAARHEICHAFCWSGRRYLDEGLADFFAGNLNAADEDDNKGPSTRSLIEIENGSDLHLERHAEDSVAAMRLRRRAAALAKELATRLGAAGVRQLYEQLLGLGGSDAADRVERALGRPLQAWDHERGDPKTTPLASALTLLVDLETTADRPEPAMLETLDGHIRDARRDRAQAKAVSDLLVRRAALERRGAGFRALAAQREVVAATAAALSRAEEDGPLRAGGLGIRLSGVNLIGDGGFRLSIDGLRLRSGERVGLIGPNGSGKSTLLSLIAAPASPGVTLDGISARSWMAHGPNRQKLGLALSEFPYHPAVRVREVIELHRALYGPPDPEIVRAFDLSAHGALRLNELSRGWRQILCLYFAFAHNPGLVLLDEPSIGLDDTHASALRSLLDPRRNTRPQTILLASHVGADLEALDRLVVLSKGEVVAAAELPDLLNAFGAYKAFVLDPDARDFADELRGLPGLRGVRRGKEKLQLSGDKTFAAEFRALASRLNLQSFGVEPATAQDILAFNSETSHV